MPNKDKLQRRKIERKNSDPCVIRVGLTDGMGNARWLTADLADCSENGVGISLRVALQPGTTIIVRGKLGAHETDVKAEVMWCVEGQDGNFHAGLELLGKKQAPPKQEKPEAPPVDAVHADLYEIMQLSPNADLDTITRVYRILAARYHPDNSESGNPELFVQLTDAYRILSDPLKRAGYDARHRETKRLQWKIFDQSATAGGVEEEKRKRLGILGLLHATTLQDPARAAVSIREFEDLLGVPREHLESPLWYLRGKGYIQRADNGRYTITVQGFDKAEEHGELQRPKGLQLLGSAS
jgi:hypothetical protein